MEAQHKAGSLKESLGDIRERMMQSSRGVDWKKVVSLATAVGAVGAIALGRRFFNGTASKNKTRTAVRRTKTKVKK